jgi:hypothetical protein
MLRREAYILEAGHFSGVGLRPEQDAAVGRGEGEKAASGGIIRRTSRTGNTADSNRGEWIGMRHKVDGLEEIVGECCSHYQSRCESICNGRDQL